MGNVNYFLTFIVGMLLPVAAVVILYFTIFKKKVCNGDLQDCPGTGTSVCVKSGTKDWQKFCTKPPSGFGGGKQMVGLGLEPGDGFCLTNCTGSNCQLSNKSACNACLSSDYGSGSWYTDNLGCKYGQSTGYGPSPGELVAAGSNYNPSYSCDNPGMSSNC